MCFENTLAENESNPRKTWDILKEAMNISNEPVKIDKITVNGNSILEPLFRNYWKLTTSLAG